MKKKCSFAGMVMIMVLLALAGCSPSEDGHKAVPTPTEKQLPSPTALQTSMPTDPLEATPVPVAVAEATPEPTSAAEPTPALPKDAVMIADGFYHVPLDDALKKRITGMSYPAEGEDCVITYDDLRHIWLLHIDFDGNVQEGELIVNKKVADEVTEIFHTLYLAGYPLTSVRLVDDFGEPHDDNASMAANNTSAFNYRRVTGSKKLSRHSYGAAIDINPMMNPYIDGDRVAPPNAVDYVDRSQKLAGMINHDDLAYQLFTQHGWSWGGDWKRDKDYQHFSKDLGY